ncbi:hypothetical protein E2320_013709 [Naja naja]|nr:hypothetical protein E2320_013709 [Naja naja]
MSSGLEPFCSFSTKVFLEPEGQKWDARKVSCDPTHLSGLSGASGIEELAGILGASITFRLETSPPYENVTWSKMDGNKSINIVKVTFAEPCGHQVSLPAFLNRVNISKDCRELHLSHLKQEDAGRYSAQIVLPKKAELVESFDLQVSSKYPSHVIPDVLPLPRLTGGDFCLWGGFRHPIFEEAHFLDGAAHSCSPVTLTLTSVKA